MRLRKTLPAIVELFGLRFSIELGTGGISTHVFELGSYTKSVHPTCMPHLLQQCRLVSAVVSMDAAAV